MTTKTILFITILCLMITPALAADDTTAPDFTVNIKPDGNIVEVYGTVTDKAPVNVTAVGVDRLELKFDVDQWVSATIDGSDYSYEYELEDTGYHSVQIRAYDKNSNPSDIIVKTYTADFSTSGDLGLKDYISIKKAQFRTLDDLSFTTKVFTDDDAGLSFDVVNDYTEDVRVRVTITTGTYEVEDDYTITAGDDESIDEWFASGILRIGMNQFDIEVMDLSTRKVLADKTLTLTVEQGSSDQALSSTDDIPEWFKSVAELNGMTLPDTTNNAEFQAIVSDLNATIQANEDQITNLKADITDLKSKYSQFTPQTSSNEPAKASLVNGIDNNVLYIIGILILGYYFRDKFSFLRGSSNGPGITDDEMERMYEAQKPGPQ
ncbi:hypothetical protein HNV12_06495 [Methanococcoides sp. SA1]|nr:hypothetical protein [Methanococcoides sp. SA1]